MKLRGLREQLALWHAGLMALTLLALAAFTYMLLGRLLNSRADVALREAADNTARQIATRLYTLETRRAAGLTPPKKVQFLTDDVRSWGRYIQIIDPQGNAVEKSDGLASHQLPVNSTPLRRGLEGLTTLETVSVMGEQRVRIATVPVLMGNRVPLLVQAGTSLEGIDAALQRAGWTLAILTPTVFILALLGNWLVIGRALRRVDDLTRTALDIQSTNLQRRIQHAGTDDEIGRLARAFDQMIGRLDRSFQQVRQFSADASHELKTPLTAIRGEAEVALMGQSSPEEYRRSIKSILESAERMSEIVESLLLLARADSGQSMVEHEPVNVGELVLGATDGLEHFARRQKVTLTLGEVEDVEVLGDALWLNQVVTNLVSNGLKYTPAGGMVTVELRRAGPTAELTVRDTGIGISEEHQARIFDRFYRVDHGRARTAGGTGLGLSITRWAVEAHGGEISVSSTPAEGSVFTVRLPLIDAAPLPTEAASAATAG